MYFFILKVSVLRLQFPKYLFTLKGTFKLYEEVAFAKTRPHVKGNKT